MIYTNPWGLKIPDDIKQMVVNNTAKVIIYYEYDDISENKFHIRVSCKLSLYHIDNDKIETSDGYFSWVSNENRTLEEAFSCYKNQLAENELRLFYKE